jgi:hypothetical protein
MKIDRLEVRTINGNGNISQIKLLGTGLSTDPTAYIANGTAVFTFATGSEITVPAYGSKVLTVVADTTNVGTIVAGKLGVVGFGTANAKGSGSGNIVQESTGTAYTAGTAVSGHTYDGTFAEGDIIYFTAGAVSGTNTLPGYYMVTTAATSEDLHLSATGLTLNGGADATIWTAGDIVSKLSGTVDSVAADTFHSTNSVSYAKGDIVYIYQSADVNGFYVVTTAAASGTAMTNMVSGVTLAAGDLVTKLSNVNALLGNTMQFEEVEPTITKNSSSPSGTVSANSDQVIAMFDITAQGSRDLTFSDFTAEVGGSNTPNLFVNHYSLYNGSTKLAEVTSTKQNVTVGEAVTVTANSAVAISGIAGMTTAGIAVGDTLTFFNVSNAAVYTGTVTAVVSGTSVTFGTSGTISTAVTQIANNRVHFNSSSSDDLPAQTVTAGQTMTLTVKADTSSVKTGVTSGTVSMTMSVPGTAGPLTTVNGGLTWTYTALNVLGTSNDSSRADNYPVSANTLSY